MKLFAYMFLGMGIQASVLALMLLTGSPPLNVYCFLVMAAIWIGLAVLFACLGKEGIIK
jgi:hypothetical protein